MSLQQGVRLRLAGLSCSPGLAHKELGEQLSREKGGILTILTVLSSPGIQCARRGCCFRDLWAEAVLNGRQP